MINYKYNLQLHSGKVRKGRKKITVPDQSMTVQEIMRRFVRGVSIDVPRKQGVYNEDAQYDLERLSRLDIDEKTEMAARLREEAVEMQRDIQEAERAKRAERAERARKAEQPQPAAKAAGKVDLDNTLPVDTAQ